MARRTGRRIVGALAAVGALLALTVAGAALWAWSAARSSLAQLDGVVGVEGLSAPAFIDRDAVGVATIRAETLEDAYFAQGFLAGQERFAQMDLMRRVAAGELSEIVGAAAYNQDWNARHYGFRAVAREVIARAPERHLRTLDAYARGVNAGVAALGARPPEHLLLRAPVEAWLPEDTVLVQFAMWLQLDSPVGSDVARARLEAALPREIADFLLTSAHRLDAPTFVPDEEGERSAMRPRALPGPGVIDLRAPAVAPGAGVEEPAPAAGSNGWAVAGSRTRDGRAILADDMHLGISAPGVWHRLQIEAEGRRWAGVSLAGVPGIVVGSNGRIAWGFTNAYGDFGDAVLLEIDPDDEKLYRTPDGWERFAERTERIEVRGGEAREITVPMTRWGPVWGEDWRGRPYAARWAAMDPSAVNVDVFDLMRADTIEEGVAIVEGWGGPPQNVMFAGDDGRIAWALSGSIPVREGVDPFAAEAWLDEGDGWSGWLVGAQRPRVIDPEAGAVWTANSRAVGFPDALRLSDAWASPVRSHRIREALLARDDWDERASFELQLDVRAAHLDFYRDFVLERVPEDHPDPLVRRAREAAASWGGGASADDTGHALVRRLPGAAQALLIPPLLRASAAGEDTLEHSSYSWLLWEQPVWEILSARPDHLLPTEYSGWDELAARMLRDAALRAGEDRLGEPWGELNRLDAPNPVFGRVPLMGWTGLGASAQPGDTGVVRVMRGSFGASQRMVVSPGREEDGILHVPGGLSGHPLSPYYRAGHEDWAEGRALPLLAGEAQHTLELRPAP